MNALAARRRHPAAIALLLMLGLLVTGFAYAAVAPDPDIVPAPPVNEDLPLEVDEKAPFEQQISCDPVDRPGVTAFALLVSEHYGRPTFFGARPCIDYASFHHDGRALDWPLAAWVSEDRMIADAVLVWLTDNDGEMAGPWALGAVVALAALLLASMTQVAAGSFSPFIYFRF